MTDDIFCTLKSSLLVSTKSGSLLIIPLPGVYKAPLETLTGPISENSVSSVVELPKPLTSKLSRLVPPQNGVLYFDRPHRTIYRKSIETIPFIRIGTLIIGNC